MAAAASVLRRQERRQEVREKKFFFNGHLSGLEPKPIVSKTTAIPIQLKMFLFQY